MPHQIDHVLIVDDRPFSRRLLISMCSMLDCRQVLYAEDQDQALAVLNEHPVEIVLLDWHLAKSEATNVLAAIRAATSDIRHTPVLMLARQADRTLIAQLVDQKADGLVIKPCAATVLAQAMQLAVDRGNNRRRVETNDSNTPNASRRASR